MPNIERIQTPLTTGLQPRTDIPHIIKYMGSKRELINEIVSAIDEIYDNEIVCDLFSGTCILSGAIGNQVPIHSNDIQEYSAVIAQTYIGYQSNGKDMKSVLNKVLEKSEEYIFKVRRLYPELSYDYNSNLSLNEFIALEQQQQDLIYFDFEELENNLFIKNYSGTYWSFEQCLWIDAIRVASEDFRNSPAYYCLLSSLMFAMAYNAQSTGHYAQYRDAYDESSMRDIIIYRTKTIEPLFIKKFKELTNFTEISSLNHQITTLDYGDCIDTFDNPVVTYADPPYVFVHYSRFYHALETLVKYDYPEVKFKGRYRTDRHQSPFCKRTEVREAFRIMFNKLYEKRSKLVLSYSNSGMISLNEILRIMDKELNDYTTNIRELEYLHSTMGRSEDKSRKVTEYLISAIPR